VKPGLGEYDRDGPESFTTIATRIRFLILANILEPKIVRELHDCIFHLFSQFIRTQRKINLGRKDRPAYESIVAYESKIAREFGDWKSLLAATNSSALCLELQKWSEDWNINADWCRDLAVNTLWLWRDQRREERGKDWGHEFPYGRLVLRSPEYIREIAKASRDLPSQEPPAGLPSYSPAIQLRKEYLIEAEITIRIREEETMARLKDISQRARLDTRLVESPHQKATLKQRTELFNKAVEYCNSLERLYNSLPGWHKTGVKKTLAEQLVQAVLFQVLRLEYETIADVLDTTTDRVGVNVRRALKTIGLDRRDNAIKRGRPSENETAQSKPTTQQKRCLKSTIKELLSQLKNDDPTNPAVVKARLKSRHLASQRR
jgi:hypothetical protein